MKRRRKKNITTIITITKEKRNITTMMTMRYALNADITIIMMSIATADAIIIMTVKVKQKNMVSVPMSTIAANPSALVSSITS